MRVIQKPHGKEIRHRIYSKIKAMEKEYLKTGAETKVEFYYTQDPYWSLQINENPYKIQSYNP